MILQDGTNLGQSFIPGTTPAQSITNGYSVSNSDGTSNSGALQPTSAPSMAAIWYYFAIIVVIVALKWLIEHEKSGVQPAIVGISVYNWLAISLMSILGIVGFKVIVNKYNIPGLQSLVNAV